MALALPAAAKMPWQVERSLAGKISAGTMKVVPLGPKLTEKKVKPYMTMKPAWWPAVVQWWWRCSNPRSGLKEETRWNSSSFLRNPTPGNPHLRYFFTLDPFPRSVDLKIGSGNSCRRGDPLVTPALLFLLLPFLPPSFLFVDVRFYLCTLVLWASVMESASYSLVICCWFSQKTRHQTGGMSNILLLYLLDTVTSTDSDQAAFLEV
uniref:Uncharacterized protein n=1 Tax=Ananas comosus var. bracteatus TaxID=296719 RepID=A0A6V7P797_ANACO|nr:unnamed protein product [Ananas comosus var. bracteatus]